MVLLFFVLWLYCAHIVSKLLLGAKLIQCKPLERLVIVILIGYDYENNHVHI